MNNQNIRRYQHSIRNYFNQLQNSETRLGRIGFTFLLKVWMFLKFFLSSRYRSERITLYKYPKETFQTSSKTIMNRYPDLFEVVSRELQNHINPRILSFGCSTGEEVRSILDYLPRANVVGVDINHRSISKARKRNINKNVKFYHYLDDNWRYDSYYDCIFAMAVFQRTKHRDASRTISLESFQYKHFSNMISLLDSMLRTDGLFIIDHTDYSFLDLASSRNYSILEFDIPISRARPVYSKDNSVKSSSSRMNRAFRKH